MKKILITLILSIFSLLTYSQTTIVMEKKNGVYLVPCTINGLRLKFIFDTGAGDVSISLSEALFMIKNGYINEKDLIGSEYYRIANGDIAEGTKIIIRKLEIGNKTLLNVEASIVHTLSAPLLLGQSAIQRFGKYSVDYTNNTLTLGNSSNQGNKINTSDSYYLKKYTVTTGTNLYPNPDGSGESIIHVYSNTFVELLDKNTGYVDYWYVTYKGYKGYIHKRAFSEE